MTATCFSRLFTAALLLSAPFLSAQVPTIQDCLGAIPVCQEVYTESQSPTGDGNYHNEINTAISCTDGEISSIWYTFTVQENGFLGFILTPNNPNDDYDWALFDITNATCSQIKTNPNLLVSCNAAGGGNCNGITGATGGTNFDIQGAGCNNFPPSIGAGYTPFNDRVPMQAGRTYVLMVSNWTQSPNGYKIDFSPSTGLGIIDQTRPQVAAVEPPDQCGEFKIHIEFSENIQCNTIANSNFRLTGPGGPYTLTVANSVCNAGGDYAREMDLIIDPPPADLGDYLFEVVSNESDQLLDLCGNPSHVLSYNFTVDYPPYINVELGGDTSLLCVGQSLQLDATNPLATYSWQDGSTGPTYNVTTPGTYKVTVVNGCGTRTDQIQISYINQPPTVSFGPDQTLCPGQTITLDATNPFGVYQWQNGASTPTFTVNGPGVYSVQVTNACGLDTDEITVDYIEPISLELGADQVLCKGTDVTFNVTQADGLTYKWQDGSTNPIYNVTESGAYSVTVTTQCETKTDQVNITFIEDPVVELGPDQTICEGESITLDITIPGAGYNWSDGSTAPARQIDQSGEYAVTVTTACNQLTDRMRLTVIDSIHTELGRDTFICGGEVIVLDASAGTQATYQWSTGETKPTLTVREPGVYSVNVANDCQAVTDRIEVKECEVCTLFLPNGFSPNGDGINDLFKPGYECQILDYQLKIFDRWGALLFETSDIEQGWNGKKAGDLLAPGVYVWWIDYTVMENGKPRKDRITGDVALLK
ncbi:MAG TPA: gliding motility-associated C-terminal domain-containing protein [Flavilitoribacter sp.]|nr:gliding motility-associated C-terminal domain-containing protein [Flavilitoribacter sp.]